MLDKIFKIFKYGAEIGWPFPQAYDSDKEGPSATLLFAYLSYFLAVVCILYTFHDGNAYTPVISSLSLFVISLIIYRIRRLEEVEVDLDDKSLKIKGNDNNNNEIKEKK